MTEICSKLIDRLKDLKLMGEKGESPMKPTLTQNEVMVMRFEHTYSKYRSGTLTCEGASEIPSVVFRGFYVLLFLLKTV